MKMKQKDIIFNILKDILGEKYSPKKPMCVHFGFTEGKRTGTNNLNPNLKKALKLLYGTYKAGAFKVPQTYEKDVAHYLRRLIYQWLKRDVRLNGKSDAKSYLSKSGNLFGKKMVSHVATDFDVKTTLNKIMHSKNLTDDMAESLVRKVLNSAYLFSKTK